MESDTGMIQKMIITSFATCCCPSYEEYVAHKMVGTGTYPSTYINTVKEGGKGSPVVVKGGG